MPCPTSFFAARTAEVHPAAHARPVRRGALAAAAVAGTLLTLSGLAGLAPASADDTLSATADDLDPLQLRIEQLSPSTVDADATRPVQLTGTVTNVSTETWTGVNVAPFRSFYPITSENGLSAAASTAVTDYVGDRLTDPGSFTTVDSLAPGESARFTATIPRDEIGSSPGVYWVGVHASGQTASIPRDEITDGRARTFLPVTAADARALRTSLVLPLRTAVRHAADGSVTDVDGWTASLSEGGELDDVLDAGAASGPHAVSWLVDPAVPHAVAQLAAGNPGWDLSADAEQVLHAPAPSASAAPEGSEESPENDDDGADGARSVAAARAWLTKFSAVLGTEGTDVHALPYGDVDVVAVARRDPESLVAAQDRGLVVLSSFGVDAAPAVAPAEGILPASTLPVLKPETLVLLQDRAVTGDGTAPVPGAGTVANRTFVTTSTGASEGGPGPESPGSALAMRQRVLSEATVRALTGDRSALVVLPPEEWDASEGTAALADQFESGTLRPRTLSSVAQSGDAVLEPTALVFGRDERAALLPRGNVDATILLRQRAGLLEAMLETPAGLDVQAQDAGWVDLSYASRTAPAAARTRTLRARRHFTDLVREVGIKGPAVVTLSGSSGRIGATVTNNLPVPVKVDVEAVSGESIALDVPNPVRVAPRSRNRLLLQADRVQQGVSSVTLKVTTLDGKPVGVADSFPVRSSQVSGILWLFTGGGAVVLFGAIAIRFFRRGLASRREQGVV